MFVNTSPFNGGFVKFALLMLAVGMVVGIIVMNSEWLNPTATRLEAAKAEEQARHQQAMNLMEEQQRIIDMQVEAKKQEAQVVAAVEFQNHVDQVAVTFTHIQRTVNIILLGALALALIIAGTVVLVRVFDRWPLPKPQPVPVTTRAATRPADIWQDKRYRRKMRETARFNEIIARTQKREQVFIQVPINGNGRYYRSSPQTQQAYRDLSRAA